MLGIKRPDNVDASLVAQALLYDSMVCLFILLLRPALSRHPINSVDAVMLWLITSSHAPRML
jgi:hypothetical protein